LNFFVARPPATPAEEATDDALERAIALVRSARKPVAIAGGGVRSANATHLFRELVAMLDMPHTATINGLGCAAPGDQKFLGMLGMHGWKAANIAVNDADVVLALGMRFDDRVTGRPDKFAKNAQIVHADIDVSEFGKIVPVAVTLGGDLRRTLEQLVRRAAERPLPRFSGWAAEAQTLGGALPADRAPHGELSATYVLDEFFAALPDDAIVATDVGQHQMWAAQRQRATHPRNFITSAGLGSMGFGLPAAIGAQFAHRDRPVFAICGDGGFQMSIAELATLRRYELPVKILLIDNQRLGMVRQWQELFYERRFSHTDLSDNPDFAMVARGYGVRAERVDDPAGLQDALRQLLAAREPMLLHCACFPAENVWPLIPPGSTVHDAMERPHAEAVPA
ncbi:MAG: acetolactate synthase large subunit, partial [Candidatus Eremiobacteraeota bacterium]|nr:acetolactate synthase large subunit [Candidatus Eremiobacteraeota bacterium]